MPSEAARGRTESNADQRKQCRRSQADGVGSHGRQRNGRQGVPSDTAKMAAEQCCLSNALAGDPDRYATPFRDGRTIHFVPQRYERDLARYGGCPSNSLTVRALTE